MTLTSWILLYITLGGVVGLKTLNDPTYNDSIDVIMKDDEEIDDRQLKLLHNKYFMLCLFFIMGVPLIVWQFFKSRKY